MERRIDRRGLELKALILEMGGLVEKSVEIVTSALHRRDVTLLDMVWPIEARINKAHIAVDEACLDVLATQSPLASDLRLILAIIKINTDLERMGDQAVNIAHNVKHYLSGPPISHGIDFATGTEFVRAMVRDTLDAFMKLDVDCAKKVLAQDDTVDAMKHDIFKKMVAFIGENPKMSEQALDLILIARNLERLGDHATNIAEDVIFAVTGRDVRHGGGES
ncbi:MAG: phosphate signaling complex protein PhoU [Bdellovibrionales bacterium]|nr:phosphate signaling complex protein PhoU [Bdellovibrionales bacterium]